MTDQEPLPAAVPNGTDILVAILWPGMALLVFIMLATLAMVLGIAWLTGVEANVAQLMSQGHNINRWLCLLIVVPAIVVLALSNKVQGSAAIAALSAIAGYVLGGTAGGAGP